MLINTDNYGIYNDLIQKGTITIYTRDINKDNLKIHFNNILAILSDGIELEEVHRMMIHVVFTDNEEVDLSIFDYIFNLIFWSLPIEVGEGLDSTKFFWCENITKFEIKDYIDNVLVKRYRTKMAFIKLNNTIDELFTWFKFLKNFQMYLANTVNLEDTIKLMKEHKEFNDTIHMSMDNIPFEDVKDKGMEAANIQIDYIKNSDHCLRDSFRTGEAISPKQFKEVNVNVGTKPSGFSEVYPYVINKSFINGGLDTPESILIESGVGRIAQILQKSNVGTSGAFARLLGLNSIDTRLHPDPNYICNTKNFQVITIKNSTILKMYDMRYYRTTPNGLDRLLDSSRDKHLIGQTLYFRSPMTCASYSHGKGICYKCYGDLAYINRDINIGKVAAELLSSIYTQLLLSAKHLLESLVIKLEWNQEFQDIFDVNFNTIQLKEDTSYKGFKLRICTPEIYNEDELDELDYNEYVTSFKIVYPDGNVVNMHTTESDSIYIHPDLIEIINKNIDIDPEIDIIDIDLDSLTNIPILFVISIGNKDLSRTMDTVKQIINNKKITKSFDRNGILEAFIDANIEGSIILNAIHFEILLANQIRNSEDILDKPYWEYENETYNILTLNESLTYNPSVTIRLEYSKISKTLYTPSTFRVTKPSNMDLFFMEKPQEFINNSNVITNNNNLIKEENESEEAIYFFDDKDKE